MNPCLNSNCNRKCKAKFCSKSCAAIVNNRKAPKRKLSKKCIVCEELITASKVYCTSCWKDGGRSLRYIKEWLAGENQGGTDFALSGYVRNYLIKQAGNACSECGWSKINPYTNKVPLEINHKNGNGSDHRPENLEVLCPSCHSLTPTYKALNKGKGRAWVYVRKRP